MAAAIILIPEMLSGPDRDPSEQPAKTAASGEGAGEASIKTYTIDLSQSPGVQPATPVEQAEARTPPPEEAPPPETSAPAPAATPVQASPEPQPVVPAEPAPRQLAAQPARAEAPPQAPPKAEPKPDPKPEPKPEPAPPKPEPRAVASAAPAPKSAASTAVPTSKGWVVQLGSYATESRAQRIAEEWRAKGQSAFVMPVTTGGKTLYRVRIGPSKDRAGAEAVLKAVKPSIASAAVVPHP